MSFLPSREYSPQAKFVSFSSTHPVANHLPRGTEMLPASTEFPIHQRLALLLEKPRGLQVGSTAQAIALRSTARRCSTSALAAPRARPAIQRHTASPVT